MGILLKLGAQAAFHAGRLYAKAGIAIATNPNAIPGAAKGTVAMAGKVAVVAGKTVVVTGKVVGGIVGGLFAAHFMGF